MAIDWEDILGEDQPLDIAYEEMVADACDKLEDCEASSFRSPPLTEDPGDPPRHCDGLYPFCDRLCDFCLYCGACEVEGDEEECGGDCTACPHNLLLQQDEDPPDMDGGDLPFPCWNEAGED